MDPVWGQLGIAGVALVVLYQGLKVVDGVLKRKAGSGNDHKVDPVLLSAMQQSAQAMQQSAQAMEAVVTSVDRQTEVTGDLRVAIIEQAGLLREQGAKLDEIRRNTERRRVAQ